MPHTILLYTRNCRTKTQKLQRKYVAQTQAPEKQKVPQRTEGRSAVAGACELGENYHDDDIFPVSLQRNQWLFYALW